MQTDSWLTIYQSSTPQSADSIPIDYYTIEATIDDTKPPVTGITRVAVYSAAEMLTISTDSRFYKPKTRITIHVNVRDIYDQPVVKRAVFLSLRSWEQSSRANNHINQEWARYTTENGAVNVDAVIEKSGSYWLFAEMTDAFGNQVTFGRWIFVFDEQPTEWLGQPDKLSLNIDKDQYQAGETAQLLIESPLAGRALLTIERTTIRQTRWVTLTPPITLVDVELQADGAPNIFITASIWEASALPPEDRNDYASPNAPDGKLHRVQINVPVAVVNKQLSVQIESDKKLYAAGDSAEITITVMDENGLGAEAEISLALVNAAIFDHSGDFSKPLFDSFYFQRTLAISSYDAYAPLRSILGGSYGDSDGVPAPEAGPQADFPDTSRWLPTIITDENGVAHLTLKLPDSLAQWQLTARAVTVDTQVGEVSYRIKTKEDSRGIFRPINSTIITD